MHEYFTVFINESGNGEALKLLNNKLNDGFTIAEQIPVGRSVIITLRKRRETVAATPVRSGSARMSEDTVSGSSATRGLTSFFSVLSYETNEGT